MPMIELPEPNLRNLVDIENIVRNASNTAAGRDALAKYIVAEAYLSRLLPLLETAEDLESLPDLHRLCNILKMIILLNDNLIIETLVVDEMIMNVVGILECMSHGLHYNPITADWFQMTQTFQATKRITANISQTLQSSKRLSSLTIQ